MKYTKVKLLFIFFIIILSSTLGAEQVYGQERTITGKIIDKSHNPTNEAEIMLFAGKTIKNKIYPLSGDMIEFYTPDIKGNFKISCRYKDVNNAIMYVTNTVPKGYMSLIDPPFNNGNSILRDRYPGTVINLNSKKMDLTYVPIDIYYAKVDVHFEQLDNSPYFMKDKATIDYKVKDVDENIVGQGSILSVPTLIGTSPFIEGSILKILLPEGYWTLEFEYHKSIVVKASVSICITDNAKTYELVLRNDK